MGATGPPPPQIFGTSISNRGRAYHWPPKVFHLPASQVWVGFIRAATMNLRRARPPEHLRRALFFFLKNLCKTFALWLIIEWGKIRTAESHVVIIRLVVRGGAGGAMAPQILADQLTLFQPRRQIVPTKWYWHLRIFRPYNGPDHNAGL